MKAKHFCIIICSILVVSITFATAYSSEPANVLNSGNKHFGKDDTKALGIYKTIEDIDIFGKDRNTASIYATIATIYKKKGGEAIKNGNKEKAIIYYKLSAKYNRTFANALMCNNGDCRASENFRKGAFWE